MTFFIRSFYIRTFFVVPCFAPVKMIKQTFGAVDH